METQGGGVATAMTPRRLTSQHSTLRETFLASDLAESLNNHGIINDNNNNNLENPRPVSNLTLGAVLNSTRKSPPPNNVVVRTLLEIIRNDEALIGGSSMSSSHFAGGKKSWKSFKDRLKLKRASYPNPSNQNQNPNSHRWAPSSPVPQSDVLPVSRSLMIREEGVNGGSPRGGGGSSFRLSEALEAEREETRQRLSTELDEPLNNGNNEEERDEEQPGLGAPATQPVRMSLMDLLEEAEQQSGVRGPTYRFDENEKPEEEVIEEEEEEIGGKGVHSCCVCMLRHKGAAFIPCGHTFCRKCSRELWVQRGNCPLCNNFILEILDIF